jgi:hypothetical protein
MVIPWRFRRRVLYVGSFALLAVLVGAWFVWKIFFSTPPSCFDGKQNGGETGLDCGGPCALLCANQVNQPVVLWALAFPTGPSTYTAAAYIQNNNNGAGARQVHYSFQLFDADNSLVVEHDGVMDLPPLQTIPIIVPNINVGNRTVAHTLFAFSETPVWEKIPAQSLPSLSVSNQNLSADATRLSATVTNNAITDASAFTAVAVLFDTSGTAQAASESTLSGLAHLSSTNVTFTWPTATPNIARAEITILPSF